MPDNSPVTEASEAASAVRHAAGRGFVPAVRAYGDALTRLREHDPARVSAEDMGRLNMDAEQVIEAIERRIESGTDGQSVQVELAEAVYGVRRKCEKLLYWHQNRPQSTP